MLRSRKIRFIEPHGRPGRPFNAWIQRWPLLGPITLATILHRRGYDVAVYNENLSGPVLDNPKAYQDICSADVVGISIMTPTANSGYTLGDRLKIDAPETTVVFGGVHASFMPDEALCHGDIVVCGEGETVIESIASGEARRGIIRAQPLENLDDLPTLDHSLMYDFEKLLALCRRRELYELPVMASRGCPHGCTYCSVTRMFGRKVRRQSVDKVYRDLCHYAERGFRHLFFYDDNFVSDRQWTKSLMERLRPMRMRFNAQARADLHWTDNSRRRRDEGLLNALRRAGGDVLYVGYETIDDSTARGWKKGYSGGGSLEARLREDTKILHESGFWIHGMFIIGPHNAPKAAHRIVNFARHSGIETIQISILTPLPGTPMMEEFRPHLIFTDYPGDWDFYDGTHCVYGHGRLGVKELQQTIMKAHRGFYTWGGWSAARRLRSLLQQRLPVLDKVAHMWRHAGITRTTMREWRKEMKEFLELVKHKAK